jgi:hypothetical protein
MRLSVKESRMKLANATNLDRKLQRRDFRVQALAWKTLFDGASDSPSSASDQVTITLIFFTIIVRSRHI